MTDLDSFKLRANLQIESITLIDKYVLFVLYCFVFTFYIANHSLAINK